MLSDGIEPEEVMNVLQTYHRRLGHLVAEHHGTIGYRAGDGIMVILNDPIPVEEPSLEALALARDMMAAFEDERVGLAEARLQHRLWDWFGKRLCHARPDR